MKPFLIKALLFGAAFFLFDKLFFVFEYYSPGTEVDKRLEFLINGQLNKDIFVIGSSRGARDIIAEEVGTATGQSVYNLSYPGSNVEFHEFVLRTLVKFNSKPKTVLLVVDEPSELSPGESIKFRLDRLYPLVKYEYINKELIDRGEKKAILSRLFVLNRINKSNFDLRKKRFNPLDTIFACGSMPVSFRNESKKWEFSHDTLSYPIEGELPAKLKAFNKILDICKSNHINLVLVFPPNSTKHSKLFENRLSILAGAHVYRYMYDTTNEIYKNKFFYYDESHLTRQGASIFTREISTFINGQDALKK